MVLTRRNRRFTTTPKAWEPTIRNPYRGLVVWTTPESIELTITLFRDQRDTQFDDKEYSVVIENVENNGHRRRIASTYINFSQFADSDNSIPSQHDIVKLRLQTPSKKVNEATMSLSLVCQFLKEGSAT